jgi:hypothetical protein
LTDKAKEFINQEETLRASLGLDPSWASTFDMPKKKKKKKDNQEGESSAKLKPFKMFKDYNFTTLNAPIMEILMEIKKDPAYKKPKRILGKSPARTANRYCAFQVANGHNTETCISLQVLSKKGSLRT